ncbi:Hypothetical protein A7982_09619 [Minicystis rosea]|nr:Hypothetical protein A7982_09619 [Minicystis rosea]
MVLGRRPLLRRRRLHIGRGVRPFIRIHLPITPRIRGRISRTAPAPIEPERAAAGGRCPPRGRRDTRLSCRPS